MMDQVPDVLPSGVEDYMKNNKQVPENLVEELQKCLSVPQQELADVTAKIEELEGHLTKLHKRRDQLQEHIARYDCVLSPIRRVPIDILHIIFSHCLPTNRDPIMSSREAPLLLTRICRAWSQTAYTSPSLWAQIYITFSDEESLPDYCITSPFTKQDLSSTLRLRCSAIEQWLSRSGGCPLSISISYTSRIWTPSPGIFPGNSENSLTLYRILARFSDRWRKLQLRMPIEVYRIFEAMVPPVSQLSALTFFRASFVHQLDAENLPEVPEPQVTFFDAPNLATLSLNFPKLWRVFSSVSSTSCLNLTTLTNLTIKWDITTSQAWSLLKRCPNLEYLALNLVTDYVQPQGTVTSTHFEGMISLPYLRAISIVDVIFSTSTNGLYECIHAPQLEWIDYAKQVGLFGEYVHEIPIIKLLKQSIGLKKLTVEANDSLYEELRVILDNAPTISHLVFGPETRSSDHSFIPSPPSGPNNYVKWNLGEFLLPDMSNKDSHEEGVDCYSALPFLPNLEVLEVSQAAATRLEDKALLDFILGRLDPNSPTERALKKVVVFFRRPQEIDIPKEVIARSHHYEHQVKLDIQYLDDPQSQEPHFVSPKYGIDALDRSWNHRDLEEEMLSS